MIPVMCVVHEGQISAEAEYALRKDLTAFVLRAFEAAPDIDWIVVPKGSGFTGAKPSRTVVASVQGNRKLSGTARATLMKELGDICMKSARRMRHEVVTFIRDPK